MTVSAAQKKAALKWNKNNMSNLAISVRRDYAEEIKAACKACGTNPGKIMRKAIDDFMDEYKSTPPDKVNNDN